MSRETWGDIAVVAGIVLVGIVLGSGAFALAMYWVSIADWL